MRKRSLISAAATLTALGGATLAYAALVERNMFTLRRFDVPVLEPDAEPLRILHLSDLHMMPGQRRKQEWVAALAGADPDLVVVTGDNMADPGAIPGVLRALDPLLGLPGAFVFGSNDYRGPVWKNPLQYLLPDREYVQGVDLPAEDLRACFVDAGWADLNNARTVVKAGGRSIEMAGVDDPHIERDDYPSVAGPISNGADLHLGVTHTPAKRVLDGMAADGFALLLAGHTHGGQVCVPGYGALTTNCDLPTSMAKGLHRWPGSDAFLHVSAGLGTHPTAPIRFACRPEASLLTLIPR
ncbi:putative MPP superfamily phosphohydrolase [Actinoplanes campanulatus]|uniref:Putative MPP superfamily phosphohydrolase n=1 Tax=Actinoplanes campanulatus TaxID=113559 RepID=A0A7W5FH95_9ACTN|nr:metallophosphoesterase [Actinoplanes campanulatus]MBB3098336.1 putative MPP superfamily phosphohydrolase [Actinoplanes campanulatus]GGN34308.1 metallophosphoesterase [Actinoplanes campanulatus]GID38705.1 metallophosphoesterase [Actinoplanes campanulatus]